MPQSPGGVTALGIILRLFFFVGLEFIGLQIFATLLVGTTGYLIAAAIGTFLAAAVANAIVVRIWERGRLQNIGMGWSRASLRHLRMGVLAGIGSAIFVMGVPIALGIAHLMPSLEDRPTPGRFLLVSVVLFFGAAGEELLFRGYGFQLLMNRLGPWATILPFGVLFGVAHLGNLNASMLGTVNTTAWGILFGYALWRSGDLWLPIGLHFGWNWTLPLFGATLSGFTMGLTGYELQFSGSQLWSGGAYGPEASLLTSFAVALLAFWLARAPIEKQTALLDSPLE